MLDATFLKKVMHVYLKVRVAETPQMSFSMGF
jgi:hypothetical protein